MDEPRDTTPPATTMEPIAAPAPAPRSFGGTVAMLLALVALVLAAFSVWRLVSIERGQGDAQSMLRNELGTRIDDLARASEQRKRDIDALRARLADTDTVN